MAETLKNGRYEQKTAWKDTTNGKVAMFFDTHTRKEVFVKEFSKTRYPSDTVTPDGRVLDSLVAAQERVERFVAKTKLINGKINEIAHAGGDVVVTGDFFRDGLHIYKVSDLIKLEDWTGAEVHEHLTAEQIDTLMLRLSNALQTLHSAGVLHCDLKPENIFIVKDRDGFYVGMLSDFDDSFLMTDVPHSNDIFCTPEYMSPELGFYKLQETDTPMLPLGAASDVFSLGLIYHEYLTGEFPEFSDEYKQLYAALLDGEPVRLSKKLDPAHRLLLYRMMITLPYDRLQSCADVSREIGNIRRRYKAEFTLHVTNGDKPLAGKNVVLTAHFKGSNEDSERYSVPLAAEKTDGSGNVVFKGLTDCEYTVRVGSVEVPVVWENRGANQYACTVNVSNAKKFRLTVTLDGRPLPDTEVKLALLDESRKPCKAYPGKTDSRGVSTYENLPVGVYRVTVGTVARNFRWTDEYKAAFAILTYTVKLTVGDAPAAGETVQLVGAGGESRTAVPVTADEHGCVTLYNLNMRMTYSIEHNGREYPLTWEARKAEVQLGGKTRLIAGVRMEGTKEPVRAARIRFGRMEDGKFTELASSLTNDKGAVLLGEFPEGEYCMAVVSMPAGTKLAGKHKPGRYVRVQLTGEKKTVVFTAAADTANVVLEQDIPESESCVYSRIVKYRDGGALLTRRSDGSTLTVRVNQLALRGLEKYM